MGGFCCRVIQSNVRHVSHVTWSWADSLFTHHWLLGCNMPGIKSLTDESLHKVCVGCAGVVVRVQDTHNVADNLQTARGQRSVAHARIIISSY